MGANIAFIVHHRSETGFHIREVCVIKPVLVRVTHGPSLYSYRLVPMGSFSRIERTTGDKATYELYGSGDLIGRLLHNRRFDHAMVAVLDCLKQIIDWVKTQDANVEFPHQ